MKRKTKLWIGLGTALVFSLAFLVIVMEPSWIARETFEAPQPNRQSWEEILSNPQPITVEKYTTGTNATELSGIMNLDHENAIGIEDEIVPIPVNAFLVQHLIHGAHLIDGGLDSSFVDNPYGVMKGIFRQELPRNRFARTRDAYGCGTATTGY